MHAHLLEYGAPKNRRGVLTSPYIHRSDTGKWQKAIGLGRVRGQRISNGGGSLRHSTVNTRDRS